MNNIDTLYRMGICLAASKQDLAENPNPKSGAHRIAKLRVRTPQPQTREDLDRSKAFTAEVSRQISVEEEIQNCDLPRLATLASNVAWRFNELAKTK